MRANANKKLSRVFCFVVVCLWSLVIGLTFSGCGGGGGGTTTTTAATGATVTGFALVPSATPTTSAKASILYFVKSLFFKELSAAVSTKPLDSASCAVSKIGTDGTLTTVSATTATTDAQGKYTLSDVAEGTNLVVVCAKSVKDDAGAEKVVTLENVVSIAAADIGTTKEGIDCGVDTTLAVENLKELVVTANEGKADADKIDGGKLSEDKVKEIKTVYANYNADINEKSNAVDLIACDKNSTNKACHDAIISAIEDLKNQISGLKSELETKINDILSSGTITGFIKDLAGNAVTSATVTISGGALTTSKSATMFSSGQYTITLPVSTTAYTVTITITGYKTITFTATIDRLMTLTKDIALTKLSAPVISEVTLSQSTITVDGQVTLSVNSKDDDGDSVTCTWSASGGTLSAATGTSITLTAPSAAATVTVTVKCSDGTNEVSATKDITVVASSTTNQNPSVTTASSDATSGTAPLTVKFTGEGSDNDGFVSSYFWDFGDGTTSNEQNPTHTYTTAGTYTITLTVSDNAGGKAASTAISITVSAATNQPPTVTASATPSSGSAPLSVSLKATASDSDGTDTTVEWDYNGDGASDWTAKLSPNVSCLAIGCPPATGSSGTFTTSYSYTASGTYTATFKATDSAGASSTQSVTITVGASNKTPTASASASVTSGTAPLTVQFTGSGTDSDGSISSFAWDFGDGTTSTEQNPSKTFSTVGSYTITLTVTDNGGATAKATTVVSVSNPATNQSPTATLSSDKTSGTTPLTVVFTVGYTDPEGAAGTYSLNAGDNSAAKTGSINSGATASVSVTYSTAGTYTAQLTVTDDKGATATKSVTITVSEPANQSPTASVSAGTSSGTAPLNVSFTVGYTDPEGKSGTYSLNYGDNSGTATGSITSGGTATVTHTYYCTSGPCSYTASLTVTDDKGATGSASVSVSVSVAGISAKQVESGGNRACAITSSGGVKCWGDNMAGALGNGTTTNSTTPVDVTGLTTGVTAVSTGGDNATGGHACTVTASGGVKCWGLNNQGQLGNGTTTNSSTPVDVSGLTSGVNVVSTGGYYTIGYHSCALTTSGGVKCWGNNSYGQLGNGTTTSSTTPVDVSMLTSSVSAVAAGGGYSCALLTSGGVKCWGYNNFGQLGNGTTINSTTAVDVTGLTSGVTSLSAKVYHACAITTSGGVKCWGLGTSGELGNGTTTSSSTPVDVTGLTSGVSMVYVGIYHNCAVTSSGGAKCWGYNANGALGNGTTANSSVPVDVSGLTNGVAGIAAGGPSCVVLSSGGIKCWGAGESGALGNGTTTNSSTPVSVTGFSGGSTGDVAVSW